MVKKFSRSNHKRKAEKITNENIDSDEEYDNENKESMIKEINDGYIITEKVNIKIN